MGECNFYTVEVAGSSPAPGIFIYMDTNKLKQLHKINYTIKRCCGLCAHSDFIRKKTSDWGVCIKFNYNHIKHTDELRKLSINRYGCCDEFKESRYLEIQLEKFSEFIETS